ncbi:Cytochrome P450 [Mycena sanguinolenta]|uniref:Cytochrome P450 n=1 Tax=Mycena sanguinolenta TaxID=230812 RepID=A0A8H7DEA5_9AGAR|nr:Cytochrome P450 [Mycena sanguinolenta]
MILTHHLLPQEMHTVLLLTGFLALIIIHWAYRWSALKSPRIPGPPAYPFIGHILQVPTTKAWKYFEKLAHQYGPIVRVSLAGDDIIVLSDPSDAEELLARRSRIYSSRRPLIYAGKYESNNLRLTIMRYGEVLKKQRAAFHQMLQPRVVGGYEEMQLAQSLRLLVDLVRTPQVYYQHFLRFPASLVFALSYGQPLDDDGKDLAELQEIVLTFVKDITPGAHLVDTFPILDRLPDVLSKWRTEAKQKHQRELEFYGRLALKVKARMEKEIGMECFAARLWDQQAKLSLSRDELFYIAGSAFAAGTDSSVVTLLWFVMAVALHPWTMQKAQKEIDSVFDANTLPSFDRMQDLPYCFALVKEVLRWSPTVPLSIPHYTDADDEYKGYKIRKGTTVISSLWNMHHNANEFPNPYTFDPERFLSPKTDAGDVSESLAEGHYAFGFGRRKCPGQHMAAKSTWIAIVRVLWAFRITPRKDADNNPMKIDPEDCTSGLTSRPHEFPVDFVPRTAAHAETIMSGERSL